jgi:hypothetical protein
LPTILILTALQLGLFVLVFTLFIQNKIENSRSKQILKYAIFGILCFLQLISINWIVEIYKYKIGCYYELYFETCSKILYILPIEIIFLELLLFLPFFILSLALIVFCTYNFIKKRGMLFLLISSIYLFIWSVKYFYYGSQA